MLTCVITVEDDSKNNLLVIIDMETSTCENRILSALERTQLLASPPTAEQPLLFLNIHAMAPLFL